GWTAWRSSNRRTVAVRTGSCPTRCNPGRRRRFSREVGEGALRAPPRSRSSAAALGAGGGVEAELGDGDAELARIGAAVRLARLRGPDRDSREAPVGLVPEQIGRASCRERVWMSVRAGRLTRRKRYV